MFTATEIQARLRRQPFVPIRVTTSSGQTFEVRHPDFAYLTRRYLQVGEAVPEEPTVPDKLHWVSILHITSIEDLPTAANPAGVNGQHES